ncbi:MAG: hypothetical protein QME75_13165 [Deltaproteobacteria bacterium]|nr:hypothetical protein [Deltaproteobacteria bacterium]
MAGFFKSLATVLFFLVFTVSSAAVLPFWQAFAQAPAGTMPAPLQKDFSADVPEDFAGALDVRIHPGEGKLQPPAELLLKDPRGRKIGHDPRAGKSYREIPLASYEFEGLDDAVSGAPGPQSGVIELRNPLAGIYVLEIIGKEPGRFSLEITGYDKDLNPSKIFLKETPIAPKGLRRFTFRYTPGRGVRHGTLIEPGKTSD